MKSLFLKPQNEGVPDHKVQQRLRGHGKNVFAPGSARGLLHKSGRIPKGSENYTGQFDYGSGADPRQSGTVSGRMNRSGALPRASRVNLSEKGSQFPSRRDRRAYNLAMTRGEGARIPLLDRASNVRRYRADKKRGILEPPPVLLKKSRTGRLTSAERRELDQRRALAPKLTAAGTGASVAALTANLGGSGLRLVGQKPKFNKKTNTTEWTDRKGAGPGSARGRISRVGGRLSGATLPITALAGGINAMAATNNARSSKLWNKRDRVYDRIERDASVFKSYESNRSRARRRNQRVVSATEGHPSVPQTVGAAAIGAGGVFGGQAGYNAVRSANAKGRLKTVQTAQRRYKVPKDMRSKASADARMLRTNIRNYSRAAKRSGAAGLGLAAGGGALIAGAGALNRRAKRNLNTELKPRQLRDSSYIYKSSVPRQIAGQMLPAPLYNYLKNTSTDARERQAILAQIERKPQLLKDGQFIRMVTGGMLGITALNLLNPGRFSKPNPDELFRGVKR